MDERAKEEDGTNAFQVVRKSQPKTHYLQCLTHKLINQRQTGWGNWDASGGVVGRGVVF